jgi:hypothetical protein
LEPQPLEWGLRGTPHREDDEKELIYELIHLPEQLPRRKWTTRRWNLEKGYSKVCHFVVIPP